MSSAPLFTEVCYGGPRNPRVCAPEPTCNTSPPPAMQGSKVCLLAPGACRRVLLALGFASEWSSTSGEQWNPRRRPRGSRRSRLDTGPGPNRGHRGRQGWQARSLLGSVMLSDFSILEPSELSELGGRQRPWSPAKWMTVSVCFLTPPRRTLCHLRLWQAVCRERPPPPFFQWVCAYGRSGENWSFGQHSSHYFAV